MERERERSIFHWLLASRGRRDRQTRIMEKREGGGGRGQTDRQTSKDRHAT